jgi:hypothetical protein
MARQAVGILEVGRQQSGVLPARTMSLSASMVSRLPAVGFIDVHCNADGGASVCPHWETCGESPLCSAPPVVEGSCVMANRIRPLGRFACGMGDFLAPDALQGSPVDACLLPGPA